MREAEQVTATASQHDIGRAVDSLILPRGGEEGERWTAKMRVSWRPGSLEFEASDGEVWSQSRIQAAANDCVEIVVPAKPLREFLRSAKFASSVSIEAVVRDQVCVRCGDSELTLGTYPVASFNRAIVDAERTVSVPLEWVRKIPLITYAAHQTDPLLRCVRWGDNTLAAGDRYRASFLEGDFGMGSLLISAPLIQRIAHLLRSDVLVGHSDRFIQIENEESRFIVHLSSGTYSDRASLIRKESASCLEVSAAELSGMTRTIQAVDADQRLHLSRVEESAPLHLSGRNPEIGDVGGILKASGDFVGSLVLDARSLGDILKSLRSNACRFEIEGSDQPIIVADDDIRHLMMPYPDG